MKRTYIGCISSRSIILDADKGYAFIERPTVAPQECEVCNDIVGSRMTVSFSVDGPVRDILTSTVQNVMDSQGYHMVMTRNSAYLFK